MGPVLGIMDDIYLDKDTSVPDIYSDNNNEVTDAGGLALFQNVTEPQSEQPVPQEPLPKEEEPKEPTVVEAEQPPAEEDTYDPFA